MIKVILDANFLIYCAEKKIDYANQIAELMGEGYELAVPRLVVRELENLKEKAEKYSDRVAASLALQLLKANKVIVFEARGRYADEAIINSSRFNVVATLDEAIRKRVSRSIVISNDKRLVFG